MLWGLLVRRWKVEWVGAGAVRDLEYCKQGFIDADCTDAWFQMLQSLCHASVVFLDRIHWPSSIS